MAKFTLSFEEDYPYFIIGITASIKDYRICWNLNKALDIALKRQDSIDVYSKSKDIIPHSFFAYSDEQVDTKYRLIENKRGNSKFLPEVAHADYLLVIDEMEGVEVKTLIKKIKEIRQILLAFEVQIDSLKQKQNLLLTA